MDSHVHTVSVDLSNECRPISPSDSASPGERKCLSSAYTCCRTYWACVTA